MLGAEHFDDAALRLMVRGGPEKYASQGAFLRSRITERAKYRLFMRLESLFKAWTGESFVAFIVRRNIAGRAALTTEGRGDA